MNELERLGRKLAAARRKSVDVLEECRTAALSALESGATEVEVAKALGVDRMTVRKWAGKR